LTLQRYGIFRNLARKTTLRTVPNFLEPFSNHHKDSKTTCFAIIKGILYDEGTPSIAAKQLVLLDDDK